MRHHHVEITGEDHKSFRGESKDCWICPAIVIDYSLLSRQMKKVNGLIRESKLPQPLLEGVLELLGQIQARRPFKEKEN